MDVDNDEEDVHICLRCLKIIIGLDNYVTHRKLSTCLKRINDTELQSEIAKRLVGIKVGIPRINNVSVDESSVENKVSNRKSVEIEGVDDNADVKEVSRNDVSIPDKSELLGIVNIFYNTLNEKVVNTTKTLETKSVPSLKADDFFSLLELQSSSKNVSSGYPSLPVSGASNHLNKTDRSNKSQYGIVTRSRSLERRKENNKTFQSVRITENFNDSKGSTSKENSYSHNLSRDVIPSVTSLEDTTFNSNEILNTEKESIDIKKGYHSSTENLITMSFGVHTESTNYPASSYSQTNDEMDEDANDHEEYDDDDEGDVIPPRNHTGGKWKPGGNPNLGTSWRTEELWSCQPPSSHTGGKWKPPIPPIAESKQPQNQSPSSTLQSEAVPDQSVQPQNTTIRYSHQPPPGHTRGKWMPIGDLSGPTLRKAGCQIQYWCGVCNRRLSSKGIYERHLKSHLHAKRTRQERQLDEDLLSPSSSLRMKLNRPIRFTRGLRQLPSSVHFVGAKQLRPPMRVGRILPCVICGAKVPRYQMGKHLVSQFHSRRAVNHPSAGSLILAYAETLARQAPFQCTLCRFYCNTMSYLLQHWDSLLHQNNDLKTGGTYWCSACRYSCVSSFMMKEHLLSKPHQELSSIINKSVPIIIQKMSTFKCPQPGCNDMYRYNAQLRQHSRLTGHDLAGCTACDSYQERTGCPHCPFVAHSRRRLNKHLSSRHRLKGGKYSCSSCSLKFNSIQEARLHRRSRDHKYRSMKQTKSAKKLQRKCLHCSKILPDIMHLKDHLKEFHPDKSHRCIRCGMTFTLKQELSRHVRSRCKGMQPVESSQGGVDSDDNIVDDKWSNKSSANFIDKWESSESISLTESTDPCTSTVSNDQCSKCTFTSTSTAELLFHTALHNDPVMSVEDGSKRQNVTLKYVCPSCPRLFRKDCLKNHLKTHTGERPFKCSECESSFSRRDVLVKHKRNVHKIMSSAGTTSQSSITTASLSGSATSLESTVKCSICDYSCSSKSSFHRHTSLHHPRSKTYLCAECGVSFYDKNTLQQHVQIHSGKKVNCFEPGCVFKCRSITELNYHLRTHFDQRPFSCGNCSYTSKTKAQLARHSKTHLGVAGKVHECKHCSFKAISSTHLRRHLRLHTGSKPYHCPYCSYTCNLLENLRKHVLSTRKHPGKSLYSCAEKNCKFNCNSAKDFRSHLVLEHNKNLAAAASFVTGLYRSSEDFQTSETIISSPRTTKGKKTQNTQILPQAALDQTAKSYLSNPTLASVANRQEVADPMSVVTVAEPADEIIYIQLASDDALDSYDSGVPFFSSTDHFLSSDRPLFFETLPANRTAMTSINSGDSALLLPPNDSERELIVIGESTVELSPSEEKKK